MAETILSLWKRLDLMFLMLCPSSRTMYSYRNLIIPISIGAYTHFEIFCKAFSFFFFSKASIKLLRPFGNILRKMKLPSFPTFYFSTFVHFHTPHRYITIYLLILSIHLLYEDHLNPSLPFGDALQGPCMYSTDPTQGTRLTVV